MSGIHSEQGRDQPRQHVWGFLSLFCGHLAEPTAWQLVLRQEQGSLLPTPRPRMQGATAWGCSPPSSSLVPWCWVGPLDPQQQPHNPRQLVTSSLLLRPIGTDRASEPYDPTALSPIGTNGHMLPMSQCTRLPWSLWEPQESPHTHVSRCSLG